MVEICRTLERPADPPAPRRLEEEGGRSEMRLRPSIMATISGRGLDEEFLSSSVVSVRADETSRGLSSAEILVQNDRQRFTDHELLEGRHLQVDLYTGYDNTKFVKRGRFYAAAPRYAFGNQAMPYIKLCCYGEEWPLAVREERRVYQNKRDSDIAQDIARRHGLRADVDQTPVIHEHVAQFNVTDMEFLENRALLHGYDVYVEDGVLHFHAPRFDHSGLNLIVGNGELGVFRSFQVVVDPWVRGSLWTKSGIDRVTGSEYEFRSTGEESDAVASEMINAARGNFIRAVDLARVGEVTPRRFIVGDGHEQSEVEARRQVDGYAKATEWVSQGSAEVRGIELMKARQVVTILGVGHLSGDYYVSQVTHCITPERGYTMEFSALRPGTSALADRFRGQALSSARRDVTNRSRQLGSAEVG